MRLLITTIALLACTFLQGQSGKVWNKVRSAYDRGKPYGGIRTCDRELAGKSPNKEFLVLRAEGHNLIGEYEKALQDGHDARHVVEPALQYDAALQLGIASAQLGRPDSARYWLNAALGGKRTTQAELQLGMLDKNAGNCTEAIARFDRVLALDGNNTVALRERGACRSVLGDTIGALIDLDRVIELLPRDPVSWNSRGYFHSENGRYREAIADYDQAIKFDPNYSYAFNNRGWAYHKLGDNGRAVRNITLAAKKKRYNPYVYRNFGLIALSEGDTVRACGHFRTALDMRFSALHGSEVEDLMRAHCASAAPAPTHSTPSDRPVQDEKRTNAPVRSNAP